MIDSKYLSYLLRHHPEDRGLKLDAYGWCKVSDLLTAVHLNKDELDQIVATNTRYVYSDDGQYIKAAHGHSINILYQDSEVAPPRYLYHGTSKRFLDSIQREGLKKMNRAAVHLSVSKKVAKNVALRHTKYNSTDVVIFELDTTKMLNDGYKFYQSEDGVWLVQDNIPYKYLVKIYPQP